MNLQGFNLDEALQDENQPIPAGEYKAIITTSEEKVNKSGTGELIVFDFQIIEGNQKGRSIKTFINWTNPNETAQKIGRAQLAKIIKATCPGQEVSRTEELHNKPLLVKIDVQRNKDKSARTDDNGAPMMQITSYKPLETVSVQPPAPAASAPWQGGTEEDVPF